MSNRAANISCKTVLYLLILSGIFLIGGTRLEAKSGKATFGIHAGPIFSNHWSTGETPEGYDRPKIETGITLSGYCNFKLSNRFSLQGEIGYAEKGARHTLEIAGFPFGPVDVTYSTEHIEIPVWIKYYVIKKEKFRLYTGAGGYYAYLTGGEYLFENDFIPNFTEEMNDLKKSDLGFMFNWGVEFKVAGFFVHLEYRFTLGLTDIAYPTGPGAPGIDLRNMGYVALLGISFSPH